MTDKPTPIAEVMVKIDHTATTTPQQGFKSAQEIIDEFFNNQGAATQQSMARLENYFGTRPGEVELDEDEHAHFLIHTHKVNKLLTDLAAERSGK